MVKRARESKRHNAGWEFLNKIILGSAEKMEAIPNNVIDLTVTSPPYWNAIDYTSHISNPNQNYRTRKRAFEYSRICWVFHEKNQHFSC